MHWWLMLMACALKPETEKTPASQTLVPSNDTSPYDTADTGFDDTGAEDTAEVDTATSSDSDSDEAGGGDTDGEDTGGGDTGGGDTGGGDTGGGDTGGGDTGGGDTGGGDTGIEPPPPGSECGDWLRHSLLSPGETIRTLETANLRPMITAVGTALRVVYSDGLVHIANRKYSTPFEPTTPDEHSSSYWYVTSIPESGAVYATLLSDGGLLTYDGRGKSAWWVQDLDGLWVPRWRSAEWVSGGPSTATLLPSGDLHVLGLSTRDFVTLGLGKITPDGRDSFYTIGTAPSMLEGLAIASSPEGDTNGYFWDSKDRSWELRWIDSRGSVRTVFRSSSTLLQPSTRAMVTSGNRPFALFDSGSTYAGTELQVLSGSSRPLVLDKVDTEPPRSCIGRPTVDGRCTLAYETLVPVDILDIGGDAAYFWLRLSKYEEYTASCSSTAASDPAPTCVWVRRSSHKKSLLQAACHSALDDRIRLDLGASSAWAGGASRDSDGHLILATFEDSLTHETSDDDHEPPVRVVYRTSAPKYPY